MTTLHATGTLPVSVIVICRDAAATLADTLDSIRAERPAQIIVAWTPTGPDDPSKAVLADYKDDVQVLEVTESGIAVARNAGLSVARAPHIAWCDADDRWRPGKLTQQLAALGDGTWVVSMIQKQGSGDRVMGFTPSAMLAKLAFVETVGPWDTRFHIAADHDWMVRARRIAEARTMDCVLVDKGFDGRNASANHLAYRRELLRWARLQGQSEVAHAESRSS